LNRTGKNLGGIDQELRLYGSLARKAQQGGNL
jgi:hypothetical protein